MWPNLQFPVDLITFTKEILNELCGGIEMEYWAKMG